MIWLNLTQRFLAVPAGGKTHGLISQAQGLLGSHARGCPCLPPGSPCAALSQALAAEVERRRRRKCRSQNALELWLGMQFL